MWQPHTKEGERLVHDKNAVGPFLQKYKGRTRPCAEPSVYSADSGPVDVGFHAYTQLS